METISELELAITPFFQASAQGLAPLMKFFSFLGTEQFFLVVMPLLLWCLDPRLGLRIAFMLALTNSVKPALKLAFHWPRPYWVDPQVTALASESSFGMPSGHAQDAASLWGLLAASLRRWWVTVVAVIVILMIGLSRIYLGVHFAHDVLAGWAVGIILVILFMLLEKPVSAWFNRLNFGGKSLAAVAAAALILLAGFAVRWSLGGWSLPPEWISNAALQWPDDPIDPLEMGGFVMISALTFGLILGLALLSLTGANMRVEGSGLQLAGRYLVGMLGLFTLYFGLKLIFPTEPEALAQIFRFVRYAVVGLWAVFAAPWLFIRLKLAQPG